MTSALSQTISVTHEPALRGQVSRHPNGLVRATSATAATIERPVIDRCAASSAAATTATARRAATATTTAPVRTTAAATGQPGCQPQAKRQQGQTLHNRILVSERDRCRKRVRGDTGFPRMRQVQNSVEIDNKDVIWEIFAGSLASANQFLSRNILLTVKSSKSSRA